MTNLPNLTDLAATRLRNNAGRYQVAYRGDELMGTVVNVADHGVSVRHRSGELIYGVRVEGSVTREYRWGFGGEPLIIRNASVARDNTLDALEELADCHNIIGVLLRERLAADEELTAGAELLIAQLEQQLREAAVTLGRIRVTLPAAYLGDQYAVQRDEVTT